MSRPLYFATLLAAFVALGCDDAADGLTDSTTTPSSDVGAGSTDAGAPPIGTDASGPIDNEVVDPPPTDTGGSGPDGVQCVEDSDCPESGDPCVIPTCVVSQGMCVQTSAANGTVCEVGGQCAIEAACQFGECVVTVPKDCDDDNPCTTDSCNDESGCLQDYNTEGCDDGNPCTKDDICSLGGCVGVVDDCDDDNPCTSDSCDPILGCQHVDTIAGCDDGDVCTEMDTCINGECIGTEVDPCEAATCGDGACNGEEVCETCPEDCYCPPPPACPTGEFQGCTGACISMALLGNDGCDVELNCAAFYGDAGDCVASASCAIGEFACGNGVCIPLASTCDGVIDCFDNTDESGCNLVGDCPVGQAIDCTGSCSTTSKLGNGSCDESFDCAAFAFDGADCGGVNTCGPGYFTCPDGECIISSWVCDGYSDCNGGADEINCGGSGGCSSTQVVNCSGGCTSAYWLGDGLCDSALNCAELNYDNGDCSFCGDGICGGDELPGLCIEDCGESLCGEGEIDDCMGGCAPEGSVGNGVCDEALNCDAYSDDGGDCCPPGQISNCIGGCTTASWLGDGICDSSSLNCEANNYDNGDCDECGDGLCGPSESFDSCQLDCDECGNGICGLGELPSTCPDDCGESTCVEGEIDGCGGAGCMLAAQVGDGVCNPELDCPIYNNDEGDCCPEGTAPGCNGECTNYPHWIGDGICDSSLDCADTQFDGGDCDECGNGFCGPEELSSTCPSDCGETTCAASEVDACGGDGLCMPAIALGDGKCDEELNCPAHGDDGGDCCPAGQVSNCIGGCTSQSAVGDGYCDSSLDCADTEFDGGDCDECGNGYCGPEELPSSCAADCGESTCPEGQVDVCGAPGTCITAVAIGDGKCDDELNCSANQNDGGDCCPDGQIVTCIGTCSSLTHWIGDGFCDSTFNCALTEWDGGDCPHCGDGTCASDENASSCPSDCGASTCEEGLIDTCTPGACIPAEKLGDGQCDADLNCDAYDLDGGDCCPEGQYSNCSGTCAYGNPGDGSCESQFNCEAAGYDGGDCDTCGNALCGPDETALNCAADCGESACAEGELDGCGGQGCVAANAKGNGVCDPALNCSPYNNDEGDCCPPGTTPACDGTCSSALSWQGDGYCDNIFDCAEAGYDGGDCAGCGDGTCQDNELPSTCPADCGESVCLEGEIDACDGASCVPASSLGDGVCDASLDCAAHEDDAGDCCPDGQVNDCFGGCSNYGNWLGDGKCDATFDCAETNWDAGDCEPDEPVSTFCDDYAETCGAWPVEQTACADWWAGSAAGAEGALSGATQGCYATHLGLAAQASDEAMKASYCEQAIGLAGSADAAPCVDAPVCEPVCGEAICQDDGCGGSCGMCDADTLTTEVSIVDMAFEPADITIVAGVTVVWKNEGAMPHSVVSRTDDGSIDADGELQGPLLETGDTFDHLFTTPGVYLYRCGPHATMLGSVTVVE